MDLENNLRAWLALASVAQCGPKTVLKLLKTFRTPEAILAASTEQLRTVQLKPRIIDALQQIDWDKIDRCLAWVAQGRVILTLDHPDYPELLRQINAPPLVLFVWGQLSCLHAPQLAIVGSRHPSESGRENSYHFSFSLAQRGFTITSGLALGIDAAAHRGALAAGGKTVAVLGSGINHIYPRINHALAQQIIENGGALVSEFFPDIPAKATHFPQRNRIISGLSSGVLVVEAAFRSGSLLTAQSALEQNREVFAIPGCINNPMAKGCHRLIKQGAKLVEDVHDILEEISYKDKSPLDATSSVRYPQTFVAPDLNQLQDQDKKLVACIDFSATPIDLIINRSGLMTEQVLARLVSLEVQGYVRSVSGGYIRSLNE
jgi:DNA processing protein